jgi:hypothetical protein
MARLFVALVIICASVSADAAKRPRPRIRTGPASAPSAQDAVGKTKIVLGMLVMPPNAKKNLTDSVRDLITDTVREGATLYLVETPKPEGEAKDPKCIQSDVCVRSIGQKANADFAIAAWFKAEAARGVLEFRLIDVKAGTVSKAVQRAMSRPDELADEVITATTLLLRDMMPEAFGKLVIETEPGANVTIDGVPSGTTPVAPISLTFGDHDVVVEKARFRTYKETVFVDASRETGLRVALEPDPVFLAEYKARANGMRALAWTGVAFAIAGATATFTLRMVANTQYDELNREVALLNQRGATFAEYEPTYARLKNVQLMDGFTWGTAAFGIVGIAMAVVGFVVGEDPHRYDAKKKLDKEKIGVLETLQLHLALTSFAISGRF